MNRGASWFVKYGSLLISIVALLFGNNLIERCGMWLVVNICSSVIVGIVFFAVAERIEAYWRRRARVEARRRLALLREQRAAQTFDSLPRDARALLLILGETNGRVVDDSSNSGIEIDDKLTDVRRGAIEDLELRGLLELKKKERRYVETYGKLTAQFRKTYLLSEKGARVCKFAKK